MTEHQDGSFQWRQLDPESLSAAPCLIEQTLCEEPVDSNGNNILGPRLAKDKSYASAVLDAWKQDELDSPSQVWTAETARVEYDDNNNLHGYLVRKGPSPPNEKLPGIVLFHTAAGPHDLFLLYKAACLANSLDGGCVVLIADLLSDSIGWGWRNDRSLFQTASQELLHSEGTTQPLLQHRLRAALKVLTELDEVDANRIAALGWCFGGHAILELGRMNIPAIRAMATFHGVFDATPLPSLSPPVEPSSSEILICHGTRDPFVTGEMVETALQTLQEHRHTVSLLQLQAKHGFSNPAQAFNENPAFGYDPEAAAKAWRQTMALLKRRLLS